jgi:polysaccharide deacetylase family protein (PEP-CTERM system associated)
MSPRSRQAGSGRATPLDTRKPKCSYPAAVNHAFTVDLEDWYHGIPIAQERKASAERRLHVGTERLLDMLARHGARATFFALGLVAREHPALLRQIAAAGHDIGSHGLSHDFVYDMSPDRFREETRASIRDLQDCIGKPVRSYRAAYFSITRRSLWALDVLAGEGIRFDSSIFPVKNWRYGIPDYSRKPAVVETAHGPILEFPLSTRRILGVNVPTTGGAYFRLYPYAVTRLNIRASEREDLPVVFYLHPWELDPEHPFIGFRKKAMVTHYARLRSTGPKIERLLADFRFGTLGEVLDAAFPGLGQ